MQQLKINRSITKRDSQAIELYFKEINKLETITPEQEVKLSIQIKEGNKEAINRLAKANLRFVVSVAKQYQNNGLPLLDLINEGNIGVLTAARLYDHTKGFKFISYAVWWIRQSIILALSTSNRLVRLPQNTLASLNKIAKATVLFEQEHERNPSVEELSEITEMSSDTINTILKANMRYTSLDGPSDPHSSEEGASSVLDYVENKSELSPDKSSDAESLSIDIKAVLDSLRENEREIIIKFYGIGCESMTLESIGALYDKTRERIRQIKDKALVKLKSKRVIRELLQKHLA